MDTNSLFNIPGIKRGVTQEQYDVKDMIPDSLDSGIVGDIVTVHNNMAAMQEERVPVPIFKLKAEEDARNLVKTFKDNEDYEELVKYVKKWRERIVGEDDTEMDHRAIAIILDNRIMFDELKRAHEVLDNSAAYFTKKTNMWDEHCAMYDKLLEDMIAADEVCDEAREVLSKLDI